jgi:hypothetical protein
VSEKYPAFPTMRYDHGGEHEGMTLRDYFAAATLQLLVKDCPPVVAAQVAYKYADAMLEAREVQP